MNKKYLTSLLMRNFRPLSSALFIALAPSLGFAKENKQPENNRVETKLQERVNGTVTSEEGPLSGVTVYVKEDSSIATATDAEGKYSIDAKAGQTLVFSTIG